jgi:hypothetical protein
VNDLVNSTARPTFLIIGAMKCGTTSLHHYLRLHPEVQLPQLKELNFFSGPPSRFPYPAGSKRIERLEEYERLFDPMAKARGEASPNYAVYPRRVGVPERIKAVVPGAKLIYLVRDPVARTVAQYRLQVATANEKRSLGEALSNLADPYSIYTCPSFYAMQFDQYLQHFRQDQILVIDQADLLYQREATLRKIFHFLSVDDSFVSPKFAERLNTRNDHRQYSQFVVLSRLARRTPLMRLPRSTRVFMRRSIERVVSRPLEDVTLDNDTRRRLEELYVDDVTRFRSLTGEAFGSWSI